MIPRPILCIRLGQSAFDAKYRETGIAGRLPSALLVDYPTMGLDHLPEVWWHGDGDVNELRCAPSRWRQ
jgi:hypothetical protein